VIRRYCSAFAGSLAIHAGVIALLVWSLWSLLPNLGPAVSGTQPERTITAFVVPREDAKFPGLNPVDPAAGAGIRALDDDERIVSFDGFTFDAGRLFERALVLFPFVSPGLSLDHFALKPGENRVFVFERPASAAAGRPRDFEIRPLVMSDPAIQAVVDKAWSRRERWAAFEPVRLLAARHSADAGALPSVFQRYTDQNALQPYRDQAIRDPRFWAQLGLAADHVRFIGFIRQYAAAHPGTRGSIELLFLLDRMAEASADALLTLLAYKPEEDLRWTRESNRQAYRLALQLLHYYRSELSRRGLYSNAAVTLHYDRVRLEILNGIVRTAPDGYRASDARFLMGTIFWNQGRQAEAIRSWRGLTCAATDSYAASCAQLARIIPREASGAQDPSLAQQIERVLKNEHGRWWDLSYDRLTRFGYRFDTY
jgi:hypothetical protein